MFCYSFEHLLESFHYIYAQQNYLAKMDLDSSIFLHENPVFMSMQVIVILVGVFSQRNNEPSKSILAK